MTPRAAFLKSQRDALIERFTRRVQDLTPHEITPTELTDHFPELLDELIEVLHEGKWPIARVQGFNRAAHAHAAQRLRLGFNLKTVVREFGVLRDCIFELMEAEQFTPTLHEHRILSDSISTATADSADRYFMGRQARADTERRQLLGLFQQAPGFLCFLRGREHVFELANAAYFQLVGHREILDKPVREALPELHGQGFFEPLDQVFDSGEPFIGRGMGVTLQREPHAPASHALVDLIYQPIRDAEGAGEVTGILVQGQDITELLHQQAQRRDAEAALHASEERDRMLFESIEDGFCLLQLIFDEQDQPTDYRFLEANTAFEHHTGLVDAVGKTAHALVPGLDPLWSARYGHVATTGESARFEHFDPAMGRCFEVYASRVGAPALRQVALLFKDITERRRIEEERGRLFELESAARRQAEEASRLRDEFLTTMSHELRTPLTSILGWVQMLRSGNLSPEKQARAIETIERNARAQAQLIQDLLDVSGILAGKLRLEVSSVDLRSIVEAALEIVRPAAEAKSIQLQATLASNATVVGDAHRLQQVVWNLLSNATKFTPKGGRVHVIVERQDSAVEITVADTGQGITREFQPHVFERFRQADGATTRPHGGLGLGLSIVRQLVELHGGTVSVHSAGEGRGATFTVRLPLAVARRRTISDHADPDPTKRLPCPPELDGLHILVVDDELDTREMLRTLLEHCGARVSLAASVAEGLQHILAGPPDLLLSDIGMPEEDGYSLIQTLRKLPSEAGGAVPAVALTAYARTEDRTRALLAGFNHHVAKPVEPLELLAVIASASNRIRPRVP